MSQKARSFEKEGDGKPCFSDAELACRLALQGRRQLLLGSNAAVTRCLRRVFLRSSSIKLASSDVSDSISLSQAVVIISQWNYCTVFYAKNAACGGARLESNPPLTTSSFKWHEDNPYILSYSTNSHSQYKTRLWTYHPL